jgi:hypothetical protein
LRARAGSGKLSPPARDSRRESTFREATLPPAAFGLAALASAASADNWPQWRGVKGDGTSAEKGLPTEWSADKNVAWKLKLPGMGAGTPVVWGDKIFLTSVDGDDVVTLCVGTDGKERWKQKLSGTGAKRYRNPSGADVSDASASCATDGKHVWASAGSGDLACYTLDGKEVWHEDLQKYGKFDIQFGVHWTPVLYKDKLYLQVMHRAAQLVVALDAATGKEVWKRSGPGTARAKARTCTPRVHLGRGRRAALVAHGTTSAPGTSWTTGRRCGGSRG